MHLYKPCAITYGYKFFIWNFVYRILKVDNSLHKILRNLIFKSYIILYIITNDIQISFYYNDRHVL